jgi:hypothetical protein
VICVAASFTELAERPDNVLPQEAVGDLNAAEKEIQDAKEKMAVAAGGKS